MVSIAQVLVWAVLYYFVFEMLTVREIIRTPTFDIYKGKARRLFIVKVCVIASVLVSGLLLGVILSEMDAFPNAFILSISMGSAKFIKLITEVYIFPLFLRLFFFFIEHKRKSSPLTIYNKIIAIWIIFLSSLYLLQSFLSVAQVVLQFLEPTTFWNSDFNLVTLSYAYVVVFPLRDTLACLTIVYLYWHQCRKVELASSSNGRSILKGQPEQVSGMTCNTYYINGKHFLV